ncbi:MAG: hypothetical protein EOM40_09115 [Clostridia bacterium]|nr:hypothetical protein [Clostridia bacterium]NCC42210.1 hypothetical protein [Clostridia bacterium]
MKTGENEVKDWPSSGISISPNTKLQSTAKKGSQNSMMILRTVYFFVCMVGTFLIVRESFGLDIGIPGMVCVIFINCLVLGISCMGTGYWKYGLYGWNIILAVVSLLYRQDFISGFYAVENKIRTQLNNYYQINLAQRRLIIEDADGGLFLAALFAVLIYVLGNLTIKKGRTAMLTLAEVFIFSLGMLCGCRFRQIGLYLVMGGAFALLSMGNKRGAKSQRIMYRLGLWAGSMIIVLSLLSALVLGPMLFEAAEKWNEQLYQQIQKVSHQVATAMQSQNGFFGDHTPTADGSLNNYEVDQTEEVELRVTLPEIPEEALYLRGFVGDTYEGSYWHRIGETKFDEAFTEGDADYQVQNILYRYISSQTDAQPETVEIERVNPGGEYGYVPYGFETPDDNNLMGDSCYTSVEDRLEYTGYAGWRQWLGDGAASGSESDIESRYQQYVADQYLKVPINGLDRLKAYCDEQNLESVQEVVDFVVAEVQSGRSYSMDLEPVPEGTDFAEYFFFDQKKGYCIHYATTATLMFRLLGVPARYVTGYVATRDSFVQSEGGYTAEVKDRQAHAWVEIYRSGKGWIPLEVTPGIQSGINQSIPGSEPTSEASPDASGEQNPDGTGETEVTPEPQVSEEGEPQPVSPDGEGDEGTIDTESENGTAGGGLGKAIAAILWIILVTGGLAAVIISGMWLNRKRIQGERKKRFLQKDVNKGVCEVSYDLYQLLKDAEIGEDEAKDIEYARRMQAKLECLEENEFEDFLKTVQQAAYGPDQLPDEQRNQCVSFYKRISNYLFGKMTKRKKFWWKYMKGYDVS